MKVTVDFCWNGNNKYSVRLEHKNHSRIVVPVDDGCKWDRKIASKCLDAIEYNWSVNRKNIRFI
jgi:hypothetical protein